MCRPHCQAWNHTSTCACEDSQSSCCTSSSSCHGQTLITMRSLYTTRSLCPLESMIDGYNRKRVMCWMCTLGPMGRDSAFVFRVCRQWTHENVVDKLATIIGVTANNMVITDMNGGEWRYPESRATSMSVMLHARRSVQPSPPLVYERGGARTVSSTLTYEEMQGQEARRE